MTVRSAYPRVFSRSLFLGNFSSIPQLWLCRSTIPYARRRACRDRTTVRTRPMSTLTSNQDFVPAQDHPRSSRASLQHHYKIKSWESPWQTSMGDKECQEVLDGRIQRTLTIGSRILERSSNRTSQKFSILWIVTYARLPSVHRPNVSRCRQCNQFCHSQTFCFKPWYLIVPASTHGLGKLQWWLRRGPVSQPKA